MTRLRQAYESACSDAKKRQEHLDNISGLVHEIKGEAGSYDYPLLTRVAESLQNFVNSVDDCRGVQLDIVGKYVEAMEAIIREKLEGNGGTTGKELLHALGIAVEKFGD